MSAEVSATPSSACRCAAHLVWVPAAPDAPAAAGSVGVAAEDVPDVAALFDLSRPGPRPPGVLAVVRDCACAARPATTRRQHARPSGSSTTKITPSTTRPED